MRRLFRVAGGVLLGVGIVFILSVFVMWALNPELTQMQAWSNWWHWWAIGVVLVVVGALLSEKGDR